MAANKRVVAPICRKRRRRNMLLHVFGLLILVTSMFAAPSLGATTSPAPSQSASLNTAGAAAAFPAFVPPPRKFARLHGWFMWAAMGLFLPTGIIVVRMTKGAVRSGASSRKVQVLVYSHMLIQTLGVACSLVGGVIGFSKFDNDFPKTHERLGLSLLILAWFMPITGLLRPQRGVRVRPFWYGLHWLIGTATVILGFINIYIGMHSYELIFSKSLRTLNILFSIQLSVMGLIYLWQDRWQYLKEQGFPTKPVAPPVQVSAV